MTGALLTVESKKLTKKQRKNFLACGLDAAFLTNVFRMVEKLCAVFNADKKLFNLAQVV